MGTDIHARVQVRKNGSWETLDDTGPSYHETEEGKKEGGSYRRPVVRSRDYDVFAVLANVRNGHGFAGVITAQKIKPISAPRGLPEGVDADGLTEPCGKYCPDEYYGCKEGRHPFCFGEHDFSWVALSELLAYPWDCPTRSCGVIDLAEYNRWDGKAPLEYCGGISGEGVVTLSEDELARADEDKIQGLMASGKIKSIHVKVWWSETMRERCRMFVKYVIPWLQTLGAPDDVRLVFGFDS